MVESGNAPEVRLKKITSGVRITVKNAKGEEHSVDVMDGLPGDDGKSAYEYAKEGGFAGTEEAFASKIAREIPSKVSELENDKSYIAAKDAPVQSVNNKTGAVNLNANDVGARSNTWTPTYSEVGADKSGTADTAVSEHNVKTDAHNDIRILLQGLSERLNAIANSTDVDLDDFKEVVAYIKSNRSLIDEITTKKINYTDIIDNLTTNVTDKPLSSAQGVALKALIDTLAENKLDASALAKAISTALAQAKESGEFDGKDGKSAYEYAKNGGYTGSEEAFSEKLAAEWQLKTDETLETESKEVVGAINELRTGKLPIVEVSTSPMSYMQDIIAAILGTGGFYGSVNFVTLTGYLSGFIAIKFNSYGGNTYRVECIDIENVTKIYNPENNNVINVSTTRIADFLSHPVYSGLPSYTEENNGQFLSVVNGVPTWVALPVAEDIVITIAEEITINGKSI